MHKDLVKEIRRDCRAAMNGVISQSMREYGLDYKLNFGLRLIQIKELANKYGKSASLAECLWNESTRELKILGTLIYPIEEFSKEKATIWALQINNQEIREQVCCNLFQELDFSEDLAFEWINQKDLNVKTTGYWLLARLLLGKKTSSTILPETMPVTFWKSLANEDLFLRNATNFVAKHLIRQSKVIGLEIMNKMDTYKNSINPIEAEVYNSLKFETEFIWEITL